MTSPTQRKVKEIYYFLNNEDVRDFIIVFHYGKSWNKVVFIHVLANGASEIRTGKIIDDDNRGYIAQMMSYLCPEGYREITYKELSIYPSIKENIDKIIREFFEQDNSTKKPILL